MMRLLKELSNTNLKDFVILLNPFKFSYHKEMLNKFSDVTKFRLINLAIIVIIFQMYLPILVSLKGEYLTVESLGLLSATVISIFGIINALSQKFVPKMLNFTKISVIYKMLTILNVIMFMISMSFLLSPRVMVWADTFVDIIIVSVQVAYSMALSNYMNYFEREYYTEFQNYRLEIFLDSSLLGMLISAIITYFYNYETSIIILSIFGFLFTVWQFKNWNIFNDKDFLYLLRYKKQKREFNKK